MVKQQLKALVTWAATDQLMIIYPRDMLCGPSAISEPHDQCYMTVVFICRLHYV